VPGATGAPPATTVAVSVTVWNDEIAVTGLSAAVSTSVVVLAVAVGAWPCAYTLTNNRKTMLRKLQIANFREKTRENTNGKEEQDELFMGSFSAPMRIPRKRGSLNRSMQHWYEVYLQESQSLKFFADVD
jgi:hypothetical protein